jgi:hypothetical protein
MRPGGDYLLRAGSFRSCHRARASAEGRAYLARLATEMPYSSAVQVRGLAEGDQVGRGDVPPSPYPAAARSRSHRATYPERLRGFLSAAPGWRPTGLPSAWRRASPARMRSDFRRDSI